MTTAVTSTLTLTATESARCNWRLRWAKRVERLLKACASGSWFLRACYPILKPVLQGFVIGILRRSDVDQWVEDAYSDCSDIYDPTHYELLHDQMAASVLNELQAGPRLLDAFCGQGREARVLAEAGFDVLGVDRMPEMIDAAQQYAADVGFHADFVCADFHEFQAQPPFDVVYTSCWMYSTLQGSDRRKAFLRQCRQLCADEGLVVLSFDPRRGGLMSNGLRFLSAKLIAMLTLGNLGSELGEQIASSGLFWHCHGERSVRREVHNAGLDVRNVVPGHDGELVLVLAHPRSTGGAA